MSFCTVHTEHDFFVGLDLGQSQDPTAICVIDRAVHFSNERDPATWLPVATRSLSLRHLERPALGTPYPRIVDRVRQVVTSPALRGRCELVVDATGVGRPVLDLLREADLDGCRVVAVTIVAGSTESQRDRMHLVPKRDLVAGLAIAFETKELAIAERLELARLFSAELVNFRMKITTAGNETFAAWREGQHDDLVLSVALACWRARREKPRALGVEQPLPGLF